MTTAETATHASDHTSDHASADDSAVTHKKHGLLKHPRVRGLVLGLGAATLVGIVIWVFFFRPYVSTDDARVAATLVRIAPEGVSGKITALNVKEGDRVKKDEVLIELDHLVPQANLAKATAKRVQADKDLDRVKKLVRQHGLPPRDLDLAESNATIARSEETLAQIALDRTYIRSPIDGLVVQKVTDMGNLLEPGQTALTIADIDHAWVSANIEETAVADVQPGQPVSIKIDEGGSLDGHVLEVRAATASQFALIQAENPSGNFTKLVQRIPLKIAIDSDESGSAIRRLRAGESVEIKIRVK